ncbi:MAG TPA: hydroxymethylbilane synthase [Thermoanaerobaculia bacterium]|nr:hydroxymethylbilane synthase [Thermoanaerobaculia bacterium]
MTLLRLGTRASPLALAQSRQVAARLEAAHPGLTVELVPMSTRGDQTSGALAPLGGKGLFTAELEEGLLAGRLDLAVHSLKDVPAARPTGLTIAAFPERADPRDVLISEAPSLAALPRGALVLTGSLRRRAQLLAARPDLDVHGLRGNVATRIARARERGAATLLAMAGLERLGMADLPLRPLDPWDFVPAPGQGILAVETHLGTPAAELVAALDHAPTREAALAERALVAAVGGDCALPLAAWCRRENGALRLTALIAQPDGRRVVRAEVLGEGPETLGREAAANLLAEGAREILRALGRTPGEP